MQSARPWFKRLIAASDEIGLERALYRMLCLVASVLSIGFVIPLNFLQNLTAWPSLISGGLGLLTLALYWLSRRGTDLPRVLIVTVTLAFDTIWFVNGGSLGSVAYYFPVTFMLVVLYFTGPWRWVVIGLLTLNFTGLLLVEQLLPQLIIPFQSSRDRFIDLATGLPIAGLASALAFGVVLREHNRERRRLQDANHELARSFAEIRTLRGLLPVCSWCHKVRNDQGLWTRIEQYLSEHTDTQVTHGICPDCELKLLAEGDGGAPPA